MSNGCPLCCGVGRVLAFGVVAEPTPIRCPECAGLEIVPASADDFPWRLNLSAPALPSPEAGDRPETPNFEEEERARDRSASCVDESFWQQRWPS